MGFEIKQCIFTENLCYKDNINKDLMGAPIGIILHDTYGGNPWLNRYLPNTDNIIGKEEYWNTNRYNNHWNQEMVYGKNLYKCVHAFIGKGVDGNVYTYQTLPWDMKGWHSGSGDKGYENSANKLGYIGFEICDDNYKSGEGTYEYCKATRDEALKLCVYLCKAYNIQIENVVCHAEAHRLGIASNHSDVETWWSKYGFTMDDFRSELSNTLGYENEESGNDSMQYMGVVNVANYLAIKNKPSQTGTNIGELKLDQKLIYIGESNNWFNIRVLDGDYKDVEGWVNGGYVEFINYTPLVEVTSDIDLELIQTAFDKIEYNQEKNIEFISIIKDELSKLV